MWVCVCVCVCACACVLHTSFTHHGGDEFGHDGAPLPHLALLAVGEIRQNARDAASTRGPAGIHQDQHLHDGGVHIPEERRRRRRREEEEEEKTL